MANSPHSESFQKIFDSVVCDVSQPLEDKLCEVRLSDEEMPNVRKQLALDITLLATALHVKKDGLTKGQYAFLGDLHDHALSQNNGDIAVDQHIARFRTLAENEVFWEPPTSLLNLLRGYDASQKTKTAQAYKELLLKIVSVTLATVETPSEKDSDIIAEFDTLWSEVLLAARTPAKRLHSDSTALIDDINQAISAFVGPTREVVTSFDMLAKMDNLKNIEAFIRRSLTNYCAQAVLVDSIVHPNELELLTDLAPTFGLFGNLGSVQNLKDKFEKVSQKVPPNEVPLLVSILDLYDEENDTRLGDRSRAIFLRLANAVFSSDLDVDPVELEWLNQFKLTLYPDGPPN